VELNDFRARAADFTEPACFEARAVQAAAAPQHDADLCRFRDKVGFRD
jgi:hypothetical protein